MNCKYGDIDLEGSYYLEKSKGCVNSLVLCGRLILEVGKIVKDLGSSNEYGL